MAATLSPEEVRDRILASLPGAVVEVTDLTGTQDHYEARVVAPQFAGVSRIARHQLVYRALGGAVGREIHALALKTMSPDGRAGGEEHPTGVDAGETRE